MSDRKRTAHNSTLAPGKPMERGPGPERKTRMKPVGDAKKRKARHREQFGPPGFLDFVHSGGACAIGMGCEGPIEAAHKRSRGAGGKWVRNILRLCRWHHRMQHQVGWTAMEERFPGFNALLEAGRLYREWERRQ